MEVENYFEGKKLNELLQACLETFNGIDEISSKLKSGIITTPHEARENLQVLCGSYGFLNTVYKIAITYKNNNEVRKFNLIRNEYEKNPIVDEKGKMKSFVNATAEREASEFVSDYRRIRNIVQSYVEICTTNIGSIQSILKSFGTERTFNEAS
jgi:hypothetical protein